MHEAHEGHDNPARDERGDDESARRADCVDHTGYSYSGRTRSEDIPPRGYVVPLETQCRTCTCGPVPAACRAPGAEDGPDIMHPSGLCRRYRYSRGTTKILPVRRGGSSC